ncbi:MAG: hypothetical protein ACYDCH_14280 [Gaiellaceae bacterium]
MADRPLEDEAGTQLEALRPYPDLDRVDYQQDIGLKKSYAYVLLSLVGAQLLIADAVFAAYAQWGVHWHLSAAVIDVWLGATFAEVVGMTTVVVRYLFPARVRHP